MSSNRIWNGRNEERKNYGALFQERGLHLFIRPPPTKESPNLLERYERSYASGRFSHVSSFLVSSANTSRRGLKAVIGRGPATPWNL